MTDPWFPDYIAAWYDEFLANWPHNDLDFWDVNGRFWPYVNSWKSRLEQDPHRQAAQLDKDLVNNNSGNLKDRNERLFYALKIASTVFLEIGFRIPMLPGDHWKSIWRHWRRKGNLLRHKDGYLLPRERLTHNWGWVAEPKDHTLEHYFRNFVRWQPSDTLKNLRVTVTVLPDRENHSWNELTIGIVPLVKSINDLKITPYDTNGPRFSVALKSPNKHILEAAISALDNCAEKKCDIVVFPELCLTPKIQSAIGKRVQKLTRYPWLIVAGSALTPVRSGSNRHHNRAVVFDSYGKTVLSYHKLHRFSVDINQQQRYGFWKNFRNVDRLEDIDIAPFEIEVLETEVGRMGVLICEDLGTEEFVNTLITKLGLDWLLVPVLDGCQTKKRWPALFGRGYARKGTCVVVGTSLSLVNQHLRAPSPPSPPRGVGLVLVPGLSRTTVNILNSSAHDHPAICNLRRTRSI